jgi:hypothetical protein
MTTNALKVYSADEVTLTFCGRALDSGFDDGEFVSIEMQSNDFVSKAGADGEVTRSKTNDRRAKITIKVMQTSKANNILTGIRTLDLGRPGGAGVGVFELRDNSGGLVAHADKAWIAKAPKVARGREAGATEWELECARMDLDINGNESV